MGVLKCIINKNDIFFPRARSYFALEIKYLLFVMLLINVHSAVAADSCANIFFETKPFNTRSLDQSALEIIKHQEQLFDALFPTAGFGSYISYVAFLKSLNDPLIKKAIEIVEQNQFEVIMARQEESRLAIATSSFKNLFQTQTSGGTPDAETRVALESTMMGISADDHKSLDHKVKAKYLSIKTKPEAGLESPVMVSPHYGPDIYTFKMEIILDQLTFFPGDSLDHVKNKLLIGSSKINPQAKIPETTDMIFLPWSRRLLMVPFMLVQLQTGRFDVPYYNPRDYRIPLSWSSFPHLYWEAQKFGNLDLSYVKTFEFRKNPPHGEFLQELIRHNILILDGRTQPVKEWIP